MTAPPRRMATLLMLVAAVPLGAQSLPTYSPLNPMAQMRSGLTTLPWFGDGRTWHASATLDYGNAIEYSTGQDLTYILDAELLNARFLVSRSIGRRGFVLGEGSVHGSYDGFLDGFLDWYHNLTGLHVAARSLRPRNEFDYELTIQDDEFRYQPTSYLGDVRLGGGLQFGKGWQTGLWVTLPTSGASNGYRMGTASVNGNLMLHRDFGPTGRFTYEGSIGVGVTPRHGELERWQRTVFFMVTQGARVRVAGPFHVYANLFYDSPYYRNTMTPELDRKELTLDAGLLFRFRHGPAWLLSMTQDLSPSGPAIDVAFRLGVYW